MKLRKLSKKAEDPSLAFFVRHLITTSTESKIKIKSKAKGFMSRKLLLRSLLIRLSRCKFKTKSLFCIFTFRRPYVCKLSGKPLLVLKNSEGKTWDGTSK